MSAKLDDRADRIMKSLLRAGEVSVNQLVQQMGASAPSIRRDLARLERRGLVLRTHGGASLVEPLLYEPFRHDTSFQAREGRQAEQKRRIGLAAADMVRENELIGLTAGTTTTQIGRSLRHRRGFSVVTNAVNIGMELCNQPAIRTMLTGGTLAWAWTFALAGQPALQFLDGLDLDRAFISATGFDLHGGVTTLEAEEALVAAMMIQRSREVIVVVDSSKIGQISPALICPVAAIHALVTDTELPFDVEQELTRQGARVIKA